jgi:hypothetical protein
MSHLTLESLARLVDEPPTVAEAAHLEACRECRRELLQFRSDAASLAALPAELPAPAGGWDVLAVRLQQEGLIQPRGRRPAWAMGAMRMAASVLLFIAGGVTGAHFFGSGPTVAPPAATAASTMAAPATAPAAGPRLAEPQPQAVTQPVLASAGAATGPSERRPAPAPAALLAREPLALPGSAREAELRLRDAEADYLQALGWWSEFVTTADGTDPMARLAALEGIEQITRAALGRAPADPVINGFHLTAMAQRDAMMRRVLATSDATWY